MSDCLLAEPGRGDVLEISHAEFVQRACDPRASVVVEACAGSGKTWLLVARILRALLAGVAPGEILAITFTRRAAQQMQERLLADLARLARSDDAGVVAMLAERGLAQAEARALIEPARALHERVLAAPVPMTVATFHGWFWKLLSIAPLNAGVPHAPMLLERTGQARREAWRRFRRHLLGPGSESERTAWLALVDRVGAAMAARLLDQWLDRRAEWWALRSAGGDALAPWAALPSGDPLHTLRAPQFVAAVGRVIGLCGREAAPSATIAGLVEAMSRWLHDGESGASRDAVADHAAIRDVFLTQKGTPRAALGPAAWAKRLAGDPVAHAAYAEAHAAVTAHLERIEAARLDHAARELNRVLATCADRLIECYQSVKDEEAAVDFNDLEWHVLRLLRDEEHAAYLQSRLDARYRQVLVDEFQDTNPLQWQVLRAWLGAYEGSGDRPGVFLVGDPKQSIYRFRRAEPRVFQAALAWLARDFGALHLRTNVTFRNAPALVRVYDAVFAGRHPGYQPQATRSTADGAFVLLPLVESGAPGAQDELADRAPADPADGEADPAGEGPADLALRDVLTTPRAEAPDGRHYEAGRQLARALSHWVGTLEVQEHGGCRAARWSDVLVLVRKRTHLAETERALRDAGVPFVSDRRGGLLDTLEAGDLAALLGLLVSPHADLKLAQTLRAPIFGASDADLISLAQVPGGSWWERLMALDESASAPLRAAQTRLRAWRAAAGVLPVHDLLDRIVHEGDLRRRYAAATPAARHSQVQANLDAFLELALALDAGRYPSLPRFVDELAALAAGGGDDAPEEGAVVQADALRIMTIHGAKGLEHPIVAIIDAAARELRDSEGVLLDWPADATQPLRMSAYCGGVEQRDPARAAAFAEEDAQRQREDWNLLYVAVTRAKQVLIVAGVRSANGSIDDTWAERLGAAAGLATPPTLVEPEPGGLPHERVVFDLRPEPCPAGSAVDEPVGTDAMRLGTAWHALLETGADLDPGFEPAVLSARYRLTPEQAGQAIAAARLVRVRQSHWFGQTAEAEVELVDEAGQLLRVDRLVEHDGALWVVDFKWRVGPAQRDAYAAQLARYVEVLRQLGTDRPIRRCLVTADGGRIDLD